MFFSLKRLYLSTIGQWLPSDFFAYRHPVSVKGVCFLEGKLILVRDERGEWDLPGGKLKKGERLGECLSREMKEELGIAVRVENLLCATLRRIENQVDVVVLIYHCSTTNHTAHLRLSSENFGIGFIDPPELDALGLPSPYLEAIRGALRR